MTSYSKGLNLRFFFLWNPPGVYSKALFQSVTMKIFHRAVTLGVLLWCYLQGVGIGYFPKVFICDWFSMALVENWECYSLRALLFWR